MARQFGAPHKSEYWVAAIILLALAVTVLLPIASAGPPTTKPVNVHVKQSDGTTGLEGVTITYSCEGGYVDDFGTTNSDGHAGPVELEVGDECEFTATYRGTTAVETHEIDGELTRLFVHRKGATRAFGAGHTELPAGLRATGQPVLVGGSMGTASYVLAGTGSAERLSFSSSCHGAGRQMSRHRAKRTWRGGDVVASLADRGILVRSQSLRGVAEEAPGAYKDVGAVVQAAHDAGISRKVARLEPLVCIKG